MSASSPLSAVLVLLLAAPALAQTENAAPDFSGIWVRTVSFQGGRSFDLPPDGGPGPIIETRMRENDDTWVGNDDNPILLPHAAEALRAHNRFIHDGGYELSPWALCSPIGVPQILNLNEPVQFLQEEDMITVIYQRDHHVRRIHLNQDHPAGVAPSWYGHSVGHFEGDALVVDTIGLNGRAPLDRFGTRATAALHVVERYRKSEDGTLLIVDFTVEDPNTFALAWSARVSYAHSADSFEEHVCAENNKDAATGDDYPIPMAVRSDF